MFNESSGRFKSFLASFKDEQGQNVRKRITFERDIKTIQEARDEKARICANLEATTRVTVERLNYIEKLQEWKTLVDEFYSWKKTKANKSTADNNKSYLLNWVLKFFLEQKSEYNYKNWPLFYSEYMVWLAHEKSDRENTKNGDNTLSINSQNNAVRALNALLSYFEDKTKEKLVRCETKESPEVMGPECIIDDKEELPLLMKKLDEIKPGFGDVAWTLRHTGMRIMELRGLNLNSCVFTSLRDDKEFVNKILKDAGFNLYGYIDLESQLAKDFHHGPYSFAKLKHRPKIHPKYSRYIPLVEKGLAEILSKRMKAANKRLLEDREKGQEKPKDQYLLFPEVTYARFRQAMEDLYKKPILNNEKAKAGPLSNYHPKRPHMFRHSFVTAIMMKFGGEPNISLAREMWGHSDLKTIQRYQQMINEMAKKQEKQKQLESIDDLEIKAL